MPSLLQRAYTASPVWLQQVGVSAYGVIWKQRRFGGCFQREVEEFQLREQLSDGEWAAYQTHRLRQLLKQAAEFVPYYQKALLTAGVRKQDIDHLSIQDLCALPLLEKDAIRRQPDEFIATNIRRRSLHGYLTSGTTGTPLEIKFSTEMHQKLSAAYEVRCRRWAGVDFKMSRAMIGGRVVTPQAISEPPFWRYNVAERQLYMSAFHISPANAEYYVQALNRYRPDYLVGYASSHFFLARLICEQGLEVHQPQAVLTSSEKLTAEMRETIQQAYGAPVFDGYSGVEACCLASECEHHRMHLSPDVGIVELLDDEGNPVGPNQPGEIVATGLLNFDQPLIRYRTGDRALLSPEPCPCGRQMPVLEELIGRLEDTVIGPDGREMVRFHGIFVGLPRIKEGQVIQESLSEFRLRLAVDPQFGDEDRQVIRQRFEERLGKITLKFEYVEHIERTERGKFRAVISHVRRSPSTSREQ